MAPSTLCLQLTFLLLFPWLCHFTLQGFQVGSLFILVSLFLPSARMRSEGTVVGFNLTSRVSVRPRNDTIYPTGDEGQKICGVFSENDPLQS